MTSRFENRLFFLFYNYNDNDYIYLFCSDMGKYPYIAAS